MAVCACACARTTKTVLFEFFCVISILIYRQIYLRQQNAYRKIVFISFCVNLICLRARARNHSPKASGAQNTTSTGSHTQTMDSGRKIYFHLYVDTPTFSLVICQVFLLHSSPVFFICSSSSFTWILHRYYRIPYAREFLERASPHSIPATCISRQFGAQ